jgi:putative hydrolase
MEVIMKFQFDTHTHSLASGHAYNTIQEMAKAASKKGLAMLGITEHGIAMPGTCHKYYFNNIHILPRKMYDIKLQFGVEANIMDYNGTLDMDKETLKNLDLAIASLHIPCIKPATKEQNTNAYLGAMQNPYVCIIGHPDDSRYKIDYKKLVDGAKKYNVLLELNNRSLFPGGSRTNAEENDLKMLTLCKKLQVPIVLSSDAHFADDIANFTYCLKIIEKTSFPEELIINYSMQSWNTFMKEKKNSASFPNSSISI